MDATRRKTGSHSALVLAFANACMCVRACARACLCVRARVSVCACVRVRARVSVCVCVPRTSATAATSTAIYILRRMSLTTQARRCVAGRRTAMLSIWRTSRYLSRQLLNRQAPPTPPIVPRRDQSAAGPREVVQGDARPNCTGERTVDPPGALEVGRRCRARLRGRRGAPLRMAGGRRQGGRCCLRPRGCPHTAGRGGIRAADGEGEKPGKSQVPARPLRELPRERFIPARSSRPMLAAAPRGCERTRTSLRWRRLGCARAATDGAAARPQTMMPVSSQTPTWLCADAGAGSHVLDVPCRASERCLARPDGLHGSALPFCPRRTARTTSTTTSAARGFVGAARPDAPAKRPRGQVPSTPAPRRRAAGTPNRRSLGREAARPGGHTTSAKAAGRPPPTRAQECAEPAEPPESHGGDRTSSEQTVPPSPRRLPEGRGRPVVLRAASTPTARASLSMSLLASLSMS